MVFDWLPFAMVGAVFTALGFLKVYGWTKGIAGGGGKPVLCRLLGRCPSWSRRLNVIFIAVLFGVGIGNIATCLVVLLRR